MLQKNRRALLSDERGLLCDVCQQTKPRSAFTAGMLQNAKRKSQRTLCKTCCRPRCTAVHCPTCTICRDPACLTPNDKSTCKGEITALHPKQLSKTAEDVKAYLWETCVAKEQRQGLLCDVCQQRKPRNAFTAGMLKNATHTKQRTLCKACCRPECAAASCNTCKSCCDGKCKSKTCTKPIEALHARQLPKTHREVLDYFCERCRFIKCIVRKPDNTFCSKERRGFKAQARAREAMEDFKCGECQTWLLSQETLAAHRKS